MFPTPGHPPTDGPAHIYLTESTTQRDAFLRSCSFLHGLFVHTAVVLKDIKEPTAKKFWEYMKDGMKLGAHGPHRKEFYDAVKYLAEVRNIICSIPPSLWDVQGLLSSVFDVFSFRQPSIGLQCESNVT